MTELLTAAQMRAIEAAAIASGEVTGLELMERAGAGVVEAVFEEWPELKAGTFRAVVLCGPGNNGGDGFVVARLLKEWGWEVEVFLYGDAEKLPPDARMNCERWVGMGEIKALSEYLASTKGWGCDLLVDALFGTGLSRNLRDLGNLFWNMSDMVDCWPIEFGQRRGAPAIVAVDVPSGLCADSGREFPNEWDHDPFSAKAHLTVTFHTAKCGHFLAEGPQRSSKVVIKDIGIKGSFSRKSPLGSQEHCAMVQESNPFFRRYLNKEIADHKFSHGHAFILSGPPGHGGAARMSARGALRIGAGLVTLACPPEALAENAARLDAIMLKTVADAAGLESILTDTRINALCLGPGLGLDERAAELVRVALRTVRKDAADGKSTQLRLVLDADALTLISRDPSLFAALHPNCVLTPHAGEFARLFPDIAAKLEAPATKGPAYSKVDATREAAARANCVVLFKGPDTVIASPDDTCAINSAAYDRAAPWLATAGSGDVLAGFITGLLAGGFAPQQAAETAAWLHVECARSFGPGLIAEDLPEELPKVFRALGL
jgi:hydroxyethylthiazole kinase-like uncharacterized protein yjeF